MEPKGYLWHCVQCRAALQKKIDNAIYDMQHDNIEILLQFKLNRKM